jgi:hypothetical protein
MMNYNEHMIKSIVNYNEHMNHINEHINEINHLNTFQIITQRVYVVIMNGFIMNQHESNVKNIFESIKKIIIITSKNSFKDSSYMANKICD